MEQDEQDEQLYATVCLSWETFIFIEGGEGEKEGGARGSGIVGVNRGE